MAISLLAKMEDLREKRAGLLRQMRATNEAAHAEKRTLTERESKDWDRIAAKVEEINEELFSGQSELNRMAAESFAGRHGEPVSDLEQPAVIIPPGDRFANKVKDESPRDHEPLRLGAYVKGILTGDWSRADAERHAMNAGIQGDGSYLVPTPLSTTIIDAARANSVVIKAGAGTIPMEASTLRVARILGDPPVTWKQENQPGQIGDMSFDAVTFNAKVLFGLVKISIELFEDAVGIDQVVGAAFGKSLGLEFDRVGLRGSGVDPEPRGIRNTVGVHKIDMGEDGDFFNSYARLLDAIQLVRESNFEPGAVIGAPRTIGTLEDRLLDSTGQPLRRPASYDKLQRLITTQIPTNIVHGEATNASECYVGDFTKVVYGVRTRVVLEVSRHAADGASSAFRNLQAWIRVYMRADVQVFQPGAFVLIDGITMPTVG